MPRDALNEFLSLGDGTLHPTVDEGVPLVELKLLFVFEVALPGLRCDIPDVLTRGDHLEEHCILVTSRKSAHLS